MSALPPKADMCGATRDVRFGPIADITLFDHLVGAGDEGRRQGETKRLGGLGFDNEFEPRGLLDRQIGGLGTLENFVDKDRGALEVRGVVCRVRDQTSGPRSVTV